MSLITASDAERQGLCFTSHLEKSVKLTSACARPGEMKLLGDTLSYAHVFSSV